MQKIAMSKLPGKVPRKSSMEKFPGKMGAKKLGGPRTKLTAAAGKTSRRSERNPAGTPTPCLGSRRAATGRAGGLAGGSCPVPTT